MMILTCPNCATRFFVERESIGPAGRRVKCSACATEWVAYRADDGESPDESSAPLPESAPPPGPPAPHDQEEVEHGASDHQPEKVTDAEAETTPVHDAASEPEEIETDEAEAAVTDTRWAGKAGPADSEIVEAEAPASEEASLFTDRTATAQALSKRRGGSMPLLLVLLLLVAAAVAGLVYYRSHHPPAPPAARVSGTEEPGAIRG